jgi:hypothetical protein
MCKATFFVTVKFDLLELLSYQKYTFCRTRELRPFQVPFLHNLDLRKCL